MIKYIFLMIFSTNLIFGSEKTNNENMRIGKLNLRAEKIEFDGHSYIHFINQWNFGGNQIIHDPSCKSCFKNKDNENNAKRKTYD